MDELNVSSFWVYFASGPLLWLVTTLAVYLAAVWLHRKLGGSPLLNPVMLTMFAIMGLLVLTNTDYDTYFEGAQFIHFLLGPATVALAVPVYDQLPRIRRLWLPIVSACFVGGLIAVLTAVGITLLLGGSEDLVLAMAPKSVTSPIALGIAEQIGGYPSLAAGIVLLTGIIGCALSPLVFRLLRQKDPAVQGFTLGLAAHGFGAAWAFQMGSLAGAFAGLAMALTGVFSSVVIPLVVGLML
ncbi:MAG: LrgB family protein [Natronospirillum sp.]|uniref:LrgB family protein n=1 Tax=Natronospirillum sp. TaxID=2812955 RepID=UPI0025E187D3|nr:LrgB family protein [Natronospirillum sp.]MCH8550378.1 LrgB family protein [Natronospirillum sp.]